jgi:glutathione peroxidase-family protein
MGVMMDIFKKGSFVETPYHNFFEINAKDWNKNLIKMSKFSHKTLLVVQISPYDKNFEDEFEKLINLKKSFQNDQFEILVFPSSQLEKLEVTDSEMKDKISNYKIVAENLDKINLFNRVYLNGEEICEVFKYCYRNSPLFMFREGKAAYIDKNFSKFLISKDGQVHSYYEKDIDIKEIHDNIKYIITQRQEKLKIRDDFTFFNKFY